MLFSSPVFLFLFMPLLLLLYWSVPRAARNGVLLLAVEETPEDQRSPRASPCCATPPGSC